MEEEVVDQATAARTLEELRAEIRILKDLEQLAQKVRRSDADIKWRKLSGLLQNDARMFDSEGHRRKLVIFTEHRDTLSTCRGISGLCSAGRRLSSPSTAACGREERRKVQEAFTQDKEVQILVATDAAGEGINLQRAHLMVNYDLPWNPNRLEQRFGRIHRIGQTEVCHLWNLVAEETREGEVYLRLLEKLDAEREALGGQCLRRPRQGRSRDGPAGVLIEAIRYGDRPDVKARLNPVVEYGWTGERLRELLDEEASPVKGWTPPGSGEIKEAMERAEARRLQPHFIGSFFLEAFKRLGGTIHAARTGALRDHPRPRRRSVTGTG